MLCTSHVPWRILACVGAACAMSPATVSAQLQLPSATEAPAAVAAEADVVPDSVVVPAAFHRRVASSDMSEGGGPSAQSCNECCGEPACVVYRATRACDRWYVGFSGGWQQRETVHEAQDHRTFIEFAGGFATNIQLGYKFDMVRLEAELSYMNNECNEAGAVGLSSPTTGNVNLRALMFNIYHDFDNLGWSWTPYVGAGIGLYQSELNSLYPEFFDQIPEMVGFPVNSTSDLPFAYQFRAGVSKALGERTDLTIGYRYFHGDELTFSSVPFSFFAPTFHPDGAVIHSLEFGLRVKF